MARKLFKTGEFAKLCNTTKDTLFHYDDIGLLKPVMIAENGYRYYSINQIYFFDLIAVLKEVGLNLEEIKSYIGNRDTKNFLAMLKSKDKRLRVELENLVRRRKLLNNTIKITEEAFYVDENVVELEDVDEEYFIISDKPANTSDKAVAEALGKHLEYCSKYNYYDNFSTGEIIGPENIANNSFFTTYFCSRIGSKAVKSKYLHVKPAGRYAVKYVRSSYDGLIEEYKTFVEEVQQMGLSIVGNIYEDDITNYMSESDASDYLMRIEAMVE